jgi:uncharacterized membrane protein YvbJ
MAFFPPFSSKNTRLCHRCNQQCPADEPVCVHCGKLREHELAQLNERRNEERRSHNALGLILIMISLLLAIILII